MIDKMVNSGRSFVLFWVFMILLGAAGVYMSKQKEAKQAQQAQQQQAPRRRQ